jgi:PAS domain S-box-containing protein
LPILELLVWGLCAVILALVIRHLRRTKAQAIHRIDSATGAGDDLFESAPIGYVEVNRDGIVVRLNRQYAKLLARDRAELLGKPCEELAPAPQREKYRAQIEHRMSGNAALVPYYCEYDRPDGSKVVVEVHEERLIGPGGEIDGLRMAAVDVTQRKHSDEQAFHIATELRALFQALPDFFLRMDRDGKVQEAKGGQKSDSFLAAEKFLGRNLREVLPPDAVEQFVLAQERVKRTKSMALAEFTAGPPEEQQTYEMRLLEIDWEQWIAIVRNITARKADETKLKGYAQELERKNEEMEAALLTAREATQLKSRFMANISHEIRTPMNGVLGMTELLLGTALKEEQQEYAQSIKWSATSLLTLINDILDLSRVEAGKLKIEQVPFSLKTVLEETSSLFAIQARAKGLEFITEVAPNVPATAVGDAHRLRQVFNNLLGNAIKFTDAGRISLTAVVLGEPEGRTQVRFTVQDTGIGIARNDQARIFERFIQADTSSTRKYGGTGLGLAISKELVELLGGEIGVESQPARGSQFWFTVSLGRAAAISEERAPQAAPAAKAPAQTPKPPVVGAIPVTSLAASSVPKAHAPTPPATSPPTAGSLANLTAALHGRKHRILLAEDNEINQRITVRLLEKMGLVVDAVVNGRLAVEALNKKKYDLILMDCQMPEMDGFEATAMIRNRERNSKRTPICALTANAMEGDRERCLAAGMDDYMSKPVSLEKLQEAIGRWIPDTANAPSQPSSAVVRN